MMHLGRIGRQWSWLWVCIALLGCSRQEGRLILILDNSASMAQTGTHFEIIKESVVDALQLIPASYEVGLRVYTDGGSRLVAPYRKGLAQLQVALNSIAPQGGTYIGQSLLDASKDLLQADKASQLIFITDGEGVKSDIALAQAAKSNLARLGKDFQCDFILYSKRIDVIEETPIGKIADILDCRLIMPGEQLSADSLTMSLQRIISKNFYWLWIIISFLAYLILSLLSASLLFSFQYASGVMPRQARIMASSFFFILLVIITGVHAVWFFSWLYGFAWTMAILALVILAIAIARFEKSNKPNTKGAAHDPF